MARKKVKMARNKKMTRKAKVSVVSLAVKMEKEFREIPGQLIAQCRKDVTTLKQQENKLATELKKAHALTKAIKHKCDALAAKPTSKKKFMAAKKGLDKANSVIKAMSSKVEAIKEEWKSLTEKQAKFTALNKALVEFNKEWNAQAKEMGKVKTAKRKKKVMDETQPETMMDQVVVIETQEQPTRMDAEVVETEEMEV